MLPSKACLPAGRQGFSLFDGYFFVKILNFENRILNQFPIFNDLMP
jgi:hypothetical protein